MYMVMLFCVHGHLITCASLHTFITIVSGPKTTLANDDTRQVLTAPTMNRHQADLPFERDYRSGVHV